MEKTAGAGPHVEVIRHGSPLPEGLAGLVEADQEITGIDGSYPWPAPPRVLCALYRASPEHSRAIHVKAEGAFGGGLTGGGAATIEALCQAGRETGATDLFVALAIDIETYGNAFLQIVRAPSKRIAALRRLPAPTMARSKTGFVQHLPKADGAGPRNVNFKSGEIVHLRAPCPMGLRYALPAWIGAQGMLDLARAATRYNAAFFANNAMPEYAVIFKGAPASPEQKDAIRGFFKNDFQGIDNAHRTLILNHTDDGSEIRIERLTADVKDGDFLKLLDAARDRIPIAHGVPPRMLGLMSAGQLGGAGEVAGQLFVFEHLTLKPRRRRMLDQMRPLLGELGLRIAAGEQDMAAKDAIAIKPLDLTPPGDDAETLPDLVNAGILTPDEARAILPFPGGADLAKSARTAHPVGGIAALSSLLARA